MSQHGNALAAFRQAVERSDAPAAVLAASEMEHVGERDALELCRLLACEGDQRYAPAARRWLTLLAAKPESTLDELQLATAAFAVLGRSPDSDAAWAALTGLMRAQSAKKGA